ncbi:MAG TPA: TIGR04076 family protein [Candidatus Paceibacterota bacterium]
MLPSKNNGVEIVPETTNDGSFILYDLKVEVIKPRGEHVCSHTVGDYFLLRGEQLSIPEGQFSIYSLAALMPHLTVHQRELNENDWMMTDDIIACPDPHCGGLFMITRTNKTVIRRSDTSVVPKDAKDRRALIPRLVYPNGIKAG